jgi:hypothetical protein
MRNVIALLIVLAAVFVPTPMAQVALPTVAYDYFTPRLVRIDRTASALYSAKISGFATRVAFERAGVEYDMVDDGTGGDVKAQDGIYTLRFTPSDVRLSADDVFRPFLGYINVYQYQTRAFRGNVFLEVITDEIPSSPVLSLAPDAQASPYLFNIVDNSFATGADTDVTRITKRLYQYFLDDFDFVTVLYGVSYFQAPSFITVSNDVIGIGQGFYTAASTYGSGGRLQAVVRFPISSEFDGAAPRFQRELGHRWMNYLKVPALQTGTSDWPISSLASGIMGYSVLPNRIGLDYPCLIVPETGGIRLVRRTEPQVFNDLELYLMGLIPPEQVNEHIVLTDQQVAATLTCPGFYTSMATSRVRMSDVLNAAGRRGPDWTNSPKRFRVATIFVSNDSLLSPEEMSFYSFFAARAQENKEVAYRSGFLKGMARPFAVSTGGRATLSSKITDIGPGTYTFPARGGTSLTSPGGNTNPLTVGYGRVLPDIGNSAPAGLAIFGLRQNGILVTEATVPASPAISVGRLYAEIGGGVNTGLALVNPNDVDVTLTFYFTDENGQRMSEGSTVIGPHAQFAKFLDQSPFNAATPTQGTLTFTASAPVAATALRGFVNERAEFLITTLPVANVSLEVSSEMVLFPHFADGGGWTTQFALMNPTDGTMAGRLEFYGADGGPAEVTIDNRTATSFDYIMPPRSSRSLRTTGGPNVKVGSVRMIPTFGATFGARVPTAVGIFRFRTNGITVTEAGVPAVQMSTAYRTYVAAAGNFNAGDTGSMQTGIAIANSTNTTATVQLELLTLKGAATGLTATLTVPPNAQVAKFLGQIDGFTALPVPFEGVLRMSSTTPGLSMVGLRGRYNERQEFLITAIQPIVEGVIPPNVPVFFPQIADGGGYSTQFVLINATGDNPVYGSVQFYTQSGGNLSLALR